MKFELRRACDWDKTIRDYVRENLTVVNSSTIKYWLNQVEDDLTCPVHVLLCFQDQMPVAACVWKNIGTKTVPLQLFVTEGARNLGVGRQLIERARSFGRENDVTAFVVDPWCSSARKFFRRLGMTNEQLILV